MHDLDLDIIVAANDLNEHPFYQAWREGTLPRATLARYAAEYGRFIATIPQGWATLGQHHDAHAEEEKHHAKLWGDFRTALDAHDDPCPEIDALIAEATKAFGSRAAAIGALYAFEAQQPKTAKSKLEGLREHYAVGEKGEAYFVLHAGDYGERDILAGEMAKLSDADRQEAIAACERTCKAMWNALTGVYGDASSACAPGTMPA